MIPCRHNDRLFKSLVQIPAHVGRQFSTDSGRHIHVLGIGNLGKFFAHALAKNAPGLTVTLLFHRESLVPQWQSSGKCIEAVTNGLSDKQFGFNTEVVSAKHQHEGDQDSPMIEHLIVATKAYNTTAALELIRHRLGNESTVLFLQNGMGAIDEASNVIFPDPVTRPTYYAGICSHGVYSTSPFSIVHAGLGTTVLGHVPTDNQSRPFTVSSETNTYLIRQLLDTRVLDATSCSARAIKEAQLEKLVINAMINPLTVIFNCHNGELFDKSPRAALMRLLLGEASQVVRALLSSTDQVDLSDRFSDETLFGLVVEVATKTGANISSMLQDVRAGRRTEIDYINGYIVRQGKKLGISCVHNEKIVEMVKMVHNSYRMGVNPTQSCDPFKNFCL